MEKEIKTPKLSKSLQEKLDHIEFIRETTEYQKYLERNNIESVYTTNSIFSIEYDKEVKKFTFFDLNSRDENLEPIRLKLTENSILKLLILLVRLELAVILEKKFTDRRGRAVTYYEVKASNELSHILTKNSGEQKKKEHNFNLVTYLEHYNGERDGQIKFVHPLDVLEYDQEEDAEL